MKTDPRATVGDLEALAAWDGAGAGSAPITAPVVVVVGEHEDRRGPGGRRGARRAPSPTGRVVELAGAGRRGVVEQPAALAALVADAAAGVPA